MVFNNSNINQILKNKASNFETKIQLNQKIKDGAAVVDIFLGSKNLNEFFIISPNTFLLESENANTEIQTKYDYSLDYQGINAAFVFKKNKTAYSITGGFQHLAETINSLSHSISKDQKKGIDSLSGRNFAKNMEGHLQLKFKQEFFKNVFFIADIDSRLVTYKKENLSKTFILPNPRATIQIRRTKTGTYKIGYSFSSKIQRLNYFTDNFFIQDYRSLSLGSKIVEPLKAHKYFISHIFSRVKKRILFSSSFSYLRFENEFSFESVLNENVDISRRIFVPGQKLLLFQTGLTTYFDWAKASFKIGYQQQYSEKPTQINNQNTFLENKTSS